MVVCFRTVYFPAVDRVKIFFPVTMLGKRESFYLYQTEQLITILTAGQ